MKKLSVQFQNFKKLLFEPVEADSLALFRILFGGILSYYASKEANPQVIYLKYVQPHFHFTFSLFDLLHFKVLPMEQLQMITSLVGISATWIALGFFTRAALVTFLISYGYLFLIDKTFYNNHSYLIILLAFLLAFTGSHRTLSLDALRKPLPSRIPFWNIFLLRAQICIVYFFAALVKFNPDFLSGRIMSFWLITQHKLPFLNAFVPMDFAVIFFTYASLLFDLLIGFFLCFKRTRYAAILVAILFH